MELEAIAKIVFYFILYSFLGWLMETILKTIEARKFVNSGFLTGPFCPIYGFGAIIMYFVLERFRDNTLLLFVMSFLILSIWEYIVGYLLEKIFHTKYWDYSNSKFNLQGRVCLLNSLCWAVLGTIFTLVLHPFVQGLIAPIPKEILVGATIILASIILVDTVLSIIRVTNINIRIGKVLEISEIIKQKLEELRKIKNNSANVEGIKALVEDLKEKEAKLIKRVYKQTLRLKRAFPSMKSEAINEFFNQKIELFKNDKK